MITLILNAARKKVEGQKRNIPYSKEKEKKRGIMLYWKAWIHQIKRGLVDIDNLAKRKELHNIYDNWSNLQQVTEYL